MTQAIARTNGGRYGQGDRSIQDWQHRKGSGVGEDDLVDALRASALQQLLALEINALLTTAGSIHCARVQH
jgi:hypothetical protein